MPRLSLAPALAALSLLVLLSGPVRAQQQAGGLSQTVLDQIAALELEKDARTPAQRKISSHLLYAARQGVGLPAAPAAPALRLDTGVVADAAGSVLVDISANISVAVLAQIATLGGSVVTVFPQYHAIRARVPLLQVEALAATPDVLFIRPAVRAQLQGRPAAPLLRPLIPGIRARARDALKAALGRRFGMNAAGRLGRFTLAANAGPGATTNAGSVDSQGDTTHEAVRARDFFGTTGAGVKVGVLSDSLNDSGNSYQAALDSGDVSPVTVFPGQDGGLQSAEGLAMLEIVHDLAPDAQLFFASAFNGEASFAQNIRDLRAQGCDIIIDDVFYFDEDPFQDALIAQAVNDVTASGALYFSSAGNQGSLDAQTSGAWEGDFRDSGGGQTIGTKTGTFHNFAPPSSTAVATQDPVARTTADDVPAFLFWSDPLGGSGNDYDLFLVNADGTTIADASTDVQGGAQDPFEAVNVPGRNSGGPSGRRLVIFKETNAAPRFLHLNLYGNVFAPTQASPITAYATAGQTHGHSSAAAAFSVAATPAPAAYPNPFSPSDTVEDFSSDGPRRVFFTADGTPYTPGNLSSTGGTVRGKPDLTAADGVSTTLPPNSGLNPFYGTSAAAPHAGAIAALLRSFAPSLTPAQSRALLTGTDIDIQAPGFDRDAGFGIVDAFSVLVGSVSLSGTVSAQNGTPIGGVSVTATGPATFTATTDAAGRFNIGPLSNAQLGAYTLTPSKAGFNFIPAARTVTLPGVGIGQNFVLSQPGVRTAVMGVARINHEYLVTVTLANGGGQADVGLTRATLGTSAVPTSPALPFSAGTLATGNSTSVTLHYPLSAGAPGATVALRVSGTLSGNGSFGGSFRVTLP